MEPSAPIVEALAKAPARLFVVDGVGACLSAAFLLTMGTTHPSFFGLSGGTLTALGAVAMGFAVYSLACAWRRPARPAGFLRAIALVNASYCVVTFVLAVLARETLTAWGATYFALEIAVVLVLVRVEVAVASRLAVRSGPTSCVDAPARHEPNS